MFKNNTFFFIGIVILFMTVVITMEYKLGSPEICTFVNKQKSDCLYPMPSKYQLVYNSTTQKYAIKVHEYLGDTYLGVYRTCCFTTEYTPETTFSDTCSAKSFMLEYFRQCEANKVKNSFK